jgi:hypothetical protein
MRAWMVPIMCALAACDLQEVTVAESEDVVVAEITLRAGDTIQTAYLHQTLQARVSANVRQARIEITNAQGYVLRFLIATDSLCLTGDAVGRQGACYVSERSDYPIVPGETYTLRIELATGEVMTSATRVPQAFTLLRPAAAECSLGENTTLPIAWTSSSDAWVYISETLLHGLAPILAQRGIELEDDPLELFGLSISNQDTTIVFPTELGLFQRFDEDLTAALIAIQNGLPAGVVADVTIAAADRNYVNWERGGNFNPSGLIRVASIRGDGTGTFGSIVPRRVVIHVGSSVLPVC